MISPPLSAAAQTVAAGPFGTWLAQARASLRGDVGADVPCGDCVGCCVSSYYIPVRREDKEALALIPAHHLVQAEGSPQGNLLMDYLPDGDVSHAQGRQVFNLRPSPANLPGL